MSTAPRQSTPVLPLRPLALLLACLPLFLFCQTAAHADDEPLTGLPAPELRADFNAALSGAGQYPFDATGLTAHPRESAEEILMRVHMLDTDAVVLAVAGYIRGIGGFPRLSIISEHWKGYIWWLSDKQTVEFMTAMASHEAWDGKKYKQPVSYAVECEVGLNSRYAPLFKQAGIFDMEEWCAGVAKTVNEDPKLRAELLRLKKEASFAFETGKPGASDEEREMARVLRSRAATPGEMEFMSRTRESGRESITMNCFLFFAATTHVPGRERPDWSPARLLEFADMRRGDPDSGNMFWRKEAVRTIRSHEQLDVPGTLDMIRRAHRGDIQAMRAMVHNYETGAMGFLKERSMQSFWFTLLLNSGDVPSLLSASIANCEHSWPSWEFTWIHAYLAHKRGNEEEKKLAALLMRMAEDRMFHRPFPPWLREWAEQLDKAMGGGKPAPQ